MAWNIHGQIGPQARPGVAAHGWLWELEREGEFRRVLVEVARTVWSIYEHGGKLPSEVREAIDTEGRSQVERVAALEDPPSVVSCATTGCFDRPVEAES